MVYSTLVYGGNEYGKSSHLYAYNVHFFEALILFEMLLFQGLIFTPYHRHWWISAFFRVETLLNLNAFQCKLFCE